MKTMKTLADEIKSINSGESLKNWLSNVLDVVQDIGYQIGEGESDIEITSDSLDEAADVILNEIRRRILTGLT